MSESIIVDARGLFLSQTCAGTRKALKDLSGGQVEILLISTSRENVARFARSQKWDVAIEQIGGYKLF